MNVEWFPAALPPVKEPPVPIQEQVDGHPSRSTRFEVYKNLCPCRVSNHSSSIGLSEA